MSFKSEPEFSGYIPINRKFFDHPFWKEKRSFSKSEAWLDLIRSARFEESKASELIGGRLVSWHRGQLPASLRYLSERWEWSKNKVDIFLSMLEKEGMIKRSDQYGQTVISLCNYETFNKKGQRKGHITGEISTSNTGERDSEKDTGGTATGQRRDKTNKDNNGKEGIGIDANTHTHEDQQRFLAFTEWISIHAPNVSKMKEPFTIDQFTRLKKKIPSRERVQSLLMKMHNWKPLLKKNNSAYLTILNWNGNDYGSQFANQEQRNGHQISKVEFKQ